MGNLGLEIASTKKSVSLPHKIGCKYTSMFYPCIRNLFVPSAKKRDFKMEKSSKKFEVSFCVQNYFHARTSLCDGLGVKFGNYIFLVSCPILSSTESVSSRKMVDFVINNRHLVHCHFMACWKC